MLYANTESCGSVIQSGRGFYVMLSKVGEL